LYEFSLCRVRIIFSILYNLFFIGEGRRVEGEGGERGAGGGVETWRSRSWSRGREGGERGAGGGVETGRSRSWSRGMEGGEREVGGEVERGRRRRMK